MDKELILALVFAGFDVALRCNKHRMQALMDKEQMSSCALEARVKSEAELQLILHKLQGHP